MRRWITKVITVSAITAGLAGLSAPAHAKVSNGIGAKAPHGVVASVYTQAELEAALTDTKTIGILLHPQQKTHFHVAVDRRMDVNILAVGTTVVTASGDAWVYACDNAQVYASGDAWVYAHGNAKVTATGGAIVDARGNAKVTATSKVKVFAHDHATIYTTRPESVKTHGHTVRVFSTSSL